MVSYRANELSFNGRNEISFRANELSFHSNEISSRANELSFRPIELSLRANELSFCPNEMSFRANESWREISFRAANFRYTYQPTFTKFRRNLNNRCPKREYLLANRIFMFFHPVIISLSCLGCEH